MRQPKKKFQMDEAGGASGVAAMHMPPPKMKNKGDKKRKVFSAKLRNMMK